MNFRLLPILLLLAACHQQQAAQPPAASQAPKQPAPAASAASATDDASAEAKPLSDAQIRKQAAEQVLQYAQLRHCGNADLAQTDKAGLGESDKINPADAAIILNTIKSDVEQNTIVAVLYRSDVIAADASWPDKPGDWSFVACSAGSGTSSYYLQLAGYNTSVGAGSGVSDTNLFDLIDKANTAAAREHATDPKGNPYFINTRFIESVKKQGDNLEIVSLQHAGDDSNNFPSARWKYTVHLFDLKITSSEYLGEVYYDECGLDYSGLKSQ